LAILVRAADHHPQHGAADVAPSDTCAERTRQPNAISTATKVTGSRNIAGGHQIASRGNSDPTVNDTADAAAACGVG